jgi:lipid-A-disaccharide synthase
MIVAGEASGDLHGARLAAAIQKQLPGIHICGMGGKELREQRVDILYDAAKMAVVGLVEVLTHIGDIREAQRVLHDELINNTPHLLILIDYPEFNLILARKAKKLGIPIFYYISPQVWAWRSGRVRKIARLIDRMAVILPFEKPFYKERGVNVDYVGHPLMDSIKTSLSRADFCDQYSINKDDVIIGLLPGSRKKEIISMLPVFLEAATILSDTFPNITFLLPQASSLTRKDLEAGGLANSSIDIKILTENRYDLMAACDLAMAASGTVTLELAIINVPMVVSYKVSPMTYFIGKRLVNVKYTSLVNLVADREVVPELIQDDATPENIANTMKAIWPGSKGREAMLKGLEEVRKKLGEGGASDRAAAIALDTMAPYDS